MKIRLPVLFILVFFLLPIKSALAAPRLFFEPTSSNLQKEYSYEVTIKIDVENQSAFGADALITYPKNDVEITGVTNGGFFSDFNFGNDAAAGKLELHGYFSSLYDSKSGSGTFGKIAVKSKKSTGSSALSFVCSSSGASSQILNTSGQNIINCASLNQFSLTYTGPPDPTNTTAPQPTNTMAPTQPAQPTATNAPQPPGNIDPICTGLSLSPNRGRAPLQVTLICNGNDQDGDITAAEYNFGNGNIRVVEKNIGGWGSISTDYVYPAGGNFQPTCRLRDDKQRFSSIPADCRKNITVTAATTAATGRPIATATARPTATPTMEPTPTVPSGPQQIVFEQYTPPTPTTEPILTDSENTGSDSLPRLLVGIAIILASIGSGLYLMKKAQADKHDSTPPPLVKE